MFLLLSLLAFFPSDNPQVFVPDKDVMPARVIARTAPEYTEEARQAKLEGSVELRLIVDADGTPEGIYVLRPLGLGLDEKAVEAVRDWRFAPGMKDGKMVAVVATVDVPFHLLGRRAEWHLARAAFDPPYGASSPTIKKADYPDAAGQEQYATVSLSFEIDASGVPVKIRAAKSSDAKWERQLIAMLSEWRFKPAVENGEPVAASATFDFERGRRSAS